MANVISSFLVGIGFDFDKKSATKVESGIDSIKSKALQLGAVVAGAYGVKKLATDFADSADMLGKFSQTYSVAAEDVQALGNALGESGGGLSQAMSQLEQLERFRAGLLRGDASFIASFGISSGDAQDIVNAKDAVEAYVLLAKQYENASAQQRLNMSDSLGFDQSGLLLLSKGSKSVEALLEKYRKIRPLTERMTESAAEFNRQWVEIKANVDGIADVIGNDIVEALNGPLDKTNEWIDSNRELLKTSATTFAGMSALLVGSGLLSNLSKISSIIPKIGTGLAGSLNIASKAGLVGAAGLGGYGVGSIISDNLSNETNNKIGSEIARFLALFGNEKAEQAYLLNEGVTQVPKYFHEYSSAAPTPMTRQSYSGGLYNRQEMQRTINVNATLNLDGQVVDNKIIKVVDGMAQNAIDDIESSVEG